MNPRSPHSLRHLALSVLALGIVASAAPSAALASTAPVVRCSEPPREAESLGNRHHGLVRRDSAGTYSAHFWHGFDDRLAAPAVLLEGNVVRAVYKEQSGSGTARLEPACPKDTLRESYVALPSVKETPTLHASEWLSSHDLTEGGRVEVSRSYDCGGPIANVVRQNLDEGKTIDLQRLDGRTLRAEVWHQSTGSFAVSPIVEAQGKTLRIGYRETPASGAAVACRIYTRYTFLIQGVGTEATIELKTHRVWSFIEWMLAGLASLVVAAVLLAAYQRLRPAGRPSMPAQ